MQSPWYPGGMYDNGIPQPAATWRSAKSRLPALARHLLETKLNLGWSDFSPVASTRDHGLEITSARLRLVSSRVRVIGYCFALLTLAWIGVDAATFELKVWLPLALGRIVAAIAFAAIAVGGSEPHSTNATIFRLGSLFLVPTCFFAYSLAVFAGDPASSMPLVVTPAYLDLPFIVMTGLALFPLTLRENLVLSSLLLAVFGLSIALVGTPTNFATGVAPSGNSHSFGLQPFSATWPFALVAWVAATAGMTQLHFLVAATQQSARDWLTGAYTRRFGEELLPLLFQASKRSGTAFTAIFIDLDDFKSVNDEFGHDVGDAVLREATRRVTSTLRRDDAVIRWGGEELLVLLPNTGPNEASTLIARIARTGLGHLPDGRAQTASLGVAERKHDETADALQLIGIADDRMYAAKSTGRNSVVDASATPRPFLRKVPLQPKNAHVA